MNDWYNSNLKFMFAEGFLNDFIYLDPTALKYLKILKTDSSGSSTIEFDNNPVYPNVPSPKEDINAELVILDLNRYAEAYIIFARSSLDVLAEEIFKNYGLTPIMDNDGKIKKIYFHSLRERNAEIEKYNPIIALAIKKFLDDNDFKDFNQCRIDLTHKKILDIGCTFEKEQTLNGFKYKLKRPIPMPDMIKNKNQSNFEDWLNTINKKIKDLHINIKNKIT